MRGLCSSKQLIEKARKVRKQYKQRRQTNRALCQWLVAELTHAWSLLKHEITRRRRNGSWRPETTCSISMAAHGPKNCARPDKKSQKARNKRKIYKRISRRRENGSSRTVAGAVVLGYAVNRVRSELKLNADLTVRHQFIKMCRRLASWNYKNNRKGPQTVSKEFPPQNRALAQWLVAESAHFYVQYSLFLRHKINIPKRVRSRSRRATISTRCSCDFSSITQSCILFTSKELRKKWRMCAHWLVAE